MTFDITDKEIRTIKRMARRNICRNLEQLDRKLDRIIKGTGDYIGGTLTMIGVTTVVIGAGCADSIPTENLNTWGFVMICGVVATGIGVKILNWMRE